LVGLMNTVLLRDTDIGTWKNYVGYLFLLIFIINSMILIKEVFYKKNE